jgi:uncharacterized protein
MRKKSAAFGAGTAIGTLGGLIGLGGAEFQLPLLISLFKFHGLEAIILNKAASLIVVATALPFRARTVSFAEIGAHWPIIMNLLAQAFCCSRTIRLAEPYRRYPAGPTFWPV